MKRVVIKIGSSTLVKDDGRVDAAFIGALAAECASLISEDGVQPIIVTSGSIALGLQMLGMGTDERPNDMPTLQAAAATGQVGLIRQYSDTFACFGIPVAQVLITRATTGQRESYLHTRDTIERLLELGVVPVINENDTVAVDEIRFGDNDSLAAMVATTVKADLVVLLSDIDGLYTADPRKDQDAELLETVSEMSADIEASAGGVGSRDGSGGMLTKVSAARVLMAAGIPMVICEGHRPHAVTDAVHGKQVGTRFFDENKLGMHARKSWIALGGKVKGRVTCDDGACLALRERGSSLLPVGIVAAEGEFEDGDPVDLVDTEGRLVGRGLAGYSRALLDERIGVHGAEEFINRDELVIF
ncbi:MAG: glutamate 5-kinase [Coriobacteriales bacterium]|jgi:glutamate 5-kinase